MTSLELCSARFGVKLLPSCIKPVSQCSGAGAQIHEHSLTQVFVRVWRWAAVTVLTTDCAVPLLPFRPGSPGLSPPGSVTGVIRGRMWTGKPLFQEAVLQSQQCVLLKKGRLRSETALASVWEAQSKRGVSVLLQATLLGFPAFMALWSQDMFLCSVGFIILTTVLNILLFFLGKIPLAHWVRYRMAMQRHIKEICGKLIGCHLLSCPLSLSVHFVM